MDMKKIEMHILDTIPYIPQTIRNQLLLVWIYVDLWYLFICHKYAAVVQW